ncbi:L-threonine O-3-phosphate decarboxylase [Duganella sp. CF458]|uniref:threonine-phosphate decarboxylase CobD n=1 Tax=Duganella sp. CF458 TaxID=1884368 RepID=UPI0008F0F520|nr:threonine-phosphate decarboxylase CobD [Duganella sp. CF458]SFH01960.1 L-threonine O-3-phosphate decarboxylase [Duganella sp. CF458]
MLEHGGKLREAAQRYGRNDWLDLSTGLNPQGYPAPALAVAAWHRLPEHDPLLLEAAQRYYNAPRMLAVAGTQAAIQALPRLRPPSRVVVASPSYAEHLHHWSQHGHHTSAVPYSALGAAAAAADVLVVCNPNNPTGAAVPRASLLQWGQALAARGGWLVVDEAFADTDGHHSIADATQDPGIIVLRSVGKFFGLAGLRLGFVAAREDILAPLADVLGPWAVSGPAQQVARAALEDSAWQRNTQEELHAAGKRLRTLLAGQGIASNGTALFQWWPEPRAEEFHDHMARRGIWVRLFSEAARGIRLGLPPDEASWKRLEQALNEWTER